MNPLVVAYARWTAYGLLVLSLVPAILAILDLGRSRKASYYVIRRAALVRVARWLLVILVLLILAVLLLVVPPYFAAESPPVVPSPTPAPSATPSPSPTPAPARTPTPTPTPLPTAVPTATPTRRPTATPPPIPTATSGVALPPGALTPLPSAVPAPPEAKLELLALAMEKDRRDEPIQPRSEFPPGEHDVLLFFHYDGMSDGIQVTFAWYREGELIDQCSDTWLWGQDDGRDWGEVGWTSYVCTPATGWEPGNYEIRVFIETRLQGVAQYVVTES